MEEALRARILAMAGISASVSKRVDWGVRTQGADLPAVELHLISTVSPMNLAEPGAWHRSRVQVDSWGRTYKAARDVADIIGAKAAEGGLHGFRGTLANIRFRIFRIDRGSGRDTDSVGIVHRTRQDFSVWWAPLHGV